MKKNILKMFLVIPLIINAKKYSVMDLLEIAAGTDDKDLFLRL